MKTAAEAEAAGWQRLYTLTKGFKIVKQVLRRSPWAEKRAAGEILIFDCPGSDYKDMCFKDHAVSRAFREAVHAQTIGSA